MKSETAVVIVGGGLAGMVTALELVSRGMAVELFEKSDRLGGKAGADAHPQLFDKTGALDPTLSLPEGVESDHGYHVFPKWYTNMRALWKKIGVCESEVYEGKEYLDIAPALDGQRQPFAKEPPPNLKQIMSICDLVLQPDAAVNELTLQGFLRSRDYDPEYDPITLNSFILNALTIGDMDISSRACRNVFRQWLPVFSQHNWDGLKGSLDEILIERLRIAIEQAAIAHEGSFECHFGHQLTALDVCAAGRATITIEGDCGERVYSERPVVLCIPQEVLRTLADDQLYTAAPAISELHYLRSNPFSAIDVHFDCELPGMIDEHFTLTDSPFGLTGFDIARHWPRLAARKNTVLQFVAANSRGFEGLSAAGFVKVISAELARYFPEMPERVAYFVPHINTDVPLFVNDVGSWQHRPSTRLGIADLYLASDYAQHDTDVTSMEGAIRSGLNAAEALRADHAPTSPAVDIAPTTPLPPELLHMIKLAETDPVEARLMCVGWLSAQMRGA
ncbi:MAG: FAD-dependent oxidoreductase [Pseudomonadales bacterium]